MENIAVVNYSKGPFEFDSERFSSTPREKLNLSVVPRLRYSSKSDYVGFQFDITLTAESVQVLKTGFLIGLMIKGWADMLKTGVNLTNERKRLYDICQCAWLVATGVIAQQTVVESVGEFILPAVDVSKLTEEVLLMSSDSKQE